MMLCEKIQFELVVIHLGCNSLILLGLFLFDRCGVSEVNHCSMGGVVWCFPIVPIILLIAVLLIFFWEEPRHVFSLYLGTVQLIVLEQLHDCIIEGDSHLTKAIRVKILTRICIPHFAEVCRLVVSKWHGHIVMYDHCSVIQTVLLFEGIRG